MTELTVRTMPHWISPGSLSVRISRLSPYGGIDLAQADFGRRPQQPPAAIMPLAGRNDAGLAQCAQHPAHHDRIGHQALGKGGRGNGLVGLLVQMDERVQGERKAAGTFHVTFIVTLIELVNPDPARRFPRTAGMLCCPLCGRRRMDDEDTACRPGNRNGNGLDRHGFRCR
nr:hypothetical protein [Devosia ginsengisoli]